MRFARRPRLLVTALAAAALLLTACGGDTDDGPTDSDEETEPDVPDDDDPDDADPDDAGGPDDADDPSAADGSLTIYSGRNEELVGHLFDEFTAATGIELDVRYGDTAELAITIDTEGDNSPADVYFAQDAGALGALDAQGRFVTLPDDVLDIVDPNFRSPAGVWTGITGRARVLAYNTDVLGEDEVPGSVLDLTDAEWDGRIGWAPTNGSFQAFVTALRITEGEDVARDWLEGVLANNPVTFENNTGAVEGVSRGEADVALVNHYYVYRFLSEDPDFNVANAYLPGDIGGLMNVAGVGVLSSSENQEAAFELVRFLLSEEIQQYFSEEGDAPEFPLRDGFTSSRLPSVEELDAPEVDLSRLEDLQGTLELLQEVGALE